MVFGALTRKQIYHLRSDVDLRVWELPERKYYRAVAQLLHLDPKHEIDLVWIEDVSNFLKKSFSLGGFQQTNAEDLFLG